MTEELRKLKELKEMKELNPSSTASTTSTPSTSLTAVLIFAFRGLTRRRMQTVLLLFALSIALAGTMTIMAVLSGIKEQMRRDLEQVGLDVINVHVSPSMKNMMLSPLKFADCDWMREVTGGTVAPFFATM